MLSLEVRLFEVKLSQTRVSVDQKAQNVASAFQVPERFPLWGRLLSLSKDAPGAPAAVLASARHILLVDDTYTTGATLYACYAALRPYTTARISIATLAAVEGAPSVEGPPSGTGSPPSAQRDATAPSPGP